MSNSTSVLFPPIAPTYQPVFCAEEEAITSYNIYFNLSQYNTLEEVKNIQLTIKNQKNNVTMLNSSSYPNGIKIYTDNEIISVSSNSEYYGKYDYYVVLLTSELKNALELGKYYKIQMRIGSAEFSSSTTNINAWLVENATACSEWSTITLLYGIGKPILTLEGLDGDYQSLTLNVIGTINFLDDTKETLKTYECLLFNENKTTTLASSENISPEAQNQLNYTFKYLLSYDTDYVLQINIVTRNLYKKIFEINFSTVTMPSGTLQCTLAATPDKEKGCMAVLISPLTGASAQQIAFKRSSSRSNFTIWEDIKIINWDGGTYEWKDYTIESGIWYKYCVQAKTDTGRGAEIFTVDPQICLFESMFLLKNNIQLRINYDAKISTFKKILSDTKVETIGSKFPFIKRAGGINYYNIGISGLITIHDDFYYDFTQTGEQSYYDNYVNLFKTKEEIFGNSEVVDLYDAFNEENSINVYNDFIYEREFRQFVIDYLHEDSATLLRTISEGNFIVRLMDINLSPDERLGRRVYSFTANAFEIDECTLEKLNENNIITIDESGE